MGRVFVFLLGAAVVLGGAYYYVTQMEGRDRVSEAETASQRTLPATRQAADRIEKDSQKRVDDLLKQTR
jgi:hypothetical protein